MSLGGYRRHARLRQDRRFGPAVRRRQIRIRDGDVRIPQHAPSPRIPPRHGCLYSSRQISHRQESPQDEKVAQASLLDRNLRRRQDVSLFGSRAGQVPEERGASVGAAHGPDQIPPVGVSEHPPVSHRRSARGCDSSGGRGGGSVPRSDRHVLRIRPRIEPPQGAEGARARRGRFRIVGCESAAGSAAVARSGRRREGEEEFESEGCEIVRAAEQCGGGHVRRGCRVH
mmetsp:Transcript_38147/g.114046  ORF Transcript_38147/g.114046 Transcript_38147/m.114046 type:complete len:228 (+) Transcript_38147:663-1346(+)